MKAVVKTMFLAKIKVVSVALFAVAAASGLTLAGVKSIPQEQGKPAVAEVKDKQAPALVKTEPDNVRVQGIVVDPAGKPVAGVRVVADAFRDREMSSVTGSTGAFAFEFSNAKRYMIKLLAHTPNDDKQGIHIFRYIEGKPEKEEPIRLVLKPSKDVLVSVVDRDQKPVAVALVDALGLGGLVTPGTTDADGRSTLRLPADALVWSIMAAKSGIGLDYSEHGPWREGMPAKDLPDQVSLILDGARSAKIKTIDSRGNPVASISVSVFSVRKEGKRDFFTTLGSRLAGQKTDEHGEASFDWLPITKQEIQFISHSDDYFAPSRIDMSQHETDKTSTLLLLRNNKIHGTVRKPDGTAAGGIKVIVDGNGNGLYSDCHVNTHTAADGSYEMQVYSEEAYMVAIDDTNWASPTRMGVVVREGKPVADVNFMLEAGTLIKGNVTLGPKAKPAKDVLISIDQDGGLLPAELKDKNDRSGQLMLSRFTKTDEDGNYVIRVGPGTYDLRGPARTKDEQIKVTNQERIIRDYQMPRLEFGNISGRVVRADNPKQGVAGARIEGVSTATFASLPLQALSGSDGHFEGKRSLDGMVVCAISQDRSLGGIVEITSDDEEIFIPVSSTATAHGILVDDKAEPIANHPLACGRRVHIQGPDGPFGHNFLPRVVTDDKGRFEMTGMVVGQKYDVSIMDDYKILPIAHVKPSSARHIDLGKIERGKPIAIGLGRRFSGSECFAEDGIDEGDFAPAFEATALDGKKIKLADLEGKFVLLDFWATWCAPCLAEMPDLEAVHRKFGADDRFKMLSLSLDQKIEDVVAFQEKRKLAWPLAYAGKGIDAEVPSGFGVQAIPAYVLIGPDGRIIAKGMRGRQELTQVISKALDRP